MQDLQNFGGAIKHYIHTLRVLSLQRLLTWTSLAQVTAHTHMAESRRTISTEFMLEYLGKETDHVVILLSHACTVTYRPSIES